MRPPPWQQPVLPAFRMAAESRGRLYVMCFERSSKESPNWQLSLPAQDKGPGGGYGHLIMTTASCARIPRRRRIARASSGGAAKEDKPWVSEPCKGERNPR